MAKWGEGDPRWIVEERPDATNVNNWHWTEKNASQWSKDKLKDLLTNFEIENNVGKCVVTEVTKLEGEASANNRKAKLIFFYEWTIKCEWKGTVRGSTTNVRGKIEIPNLSEENDPSEIDINITCKDDSEEGERLKQLMRTYGAEEIRQKLSQYIKELKEEFTVGMILPKKDEGVSSKSESTVTSAKNDAVRPAQTSSATIGMKKLDIIGTKIDTVKLNLKQTFKCTAEEFYNALTVKEMVQAFTQGPCKLNVEKGGRFELFSGNITGEFVQLVPHSIIEMKWRFSGWPDGHYSNVTLTISQKSDGTEVTMKQIGIPSNDLDRTKSGWNYYYWDSMKRTFGFGAMLL